MDNEIERRKILSCLLVYTTLALLLASTVFGSLNVLAQQENQTNPPQKVTAAFTYSPQNPVVDEEIQFTDRSKAVQGTIGTWSWKFGDGTKTEEKDPTHTYDSKGNYTVKLTVKTDEGKSDHRIQVLYVRGKDGGDDQEPPEEGNKSGDIGDFRKGTEGSFVSFDVSRQGISNHIFRRKGDRFCLFQDIDIEEAEIDESRSEGALYHIGGRNLDIDVYDSSSALIQMRIGQIKAETERRISFELGQIEPVDKKITGNLVDLRTGDGEMNSSLLIPNSETESFSWNYENGHINLTAEEGIRLIFRASKQGFNKGEGYGLDDHRFQEGIVNREIGGEITIEKDQNRYREMSIAYSDMDMLTHVSDRRIEVLVSSNTLRHGRTLLISFSKDVIDISDIGEESVLLDGNSLERTKDYSDLIDEKKDPKYILTEGEDKVRVMVEIPDFSSHTIQIVEETETGGEDPTGDFYFYLPAALGVAILVLISSIFWRSKEDAYTESIIDKEKEKQDGDTEEDLADHGDKKDRPPAKENEKKEEKEKKE